MATTTDRKTHTSDFVPHDSNRAVFFGNAMVDNLYTAVNALAAELWAVRRRQMVTESLLKKHGSISAEMIEQYLPTEEEKAKWSSQRDQFVNLILDPFLREADLPYAASLHPDKVD